MTPNQLHILRHSLGLDQNGHGRTYRNYYCTGKNCDGYADIIALKDAGLMKFSNFINEGRDEIFTVTEDGRREALKDVVYPKLTRSQRRMQAYRNSDSGLSFKEWLQTKWGKTAY
jgi:hypothetical protein